MVKRILKTPNITLGEDNRPKSICPHCKDIMIMDIMPFKDNISLIMQDNCPRCGGNIFVGLLILSNSSLKGLYSSIQIVIDAIDPKNKLLV